MPAPNSAAVDQLIAASPELARQRLMQIRTAVRNAIPTAQETVAYRMPAFRHQRCFFYYAAFKQHIGVYPPVHNTALRALLAPYANDKGNLRFPLDQALPLELITQVALALAQQYHMADLAPAQDQKKRRAAG